MTIIELLLAAALAVGGASAEPAAPSDETDARATIIELGATGTPSTTGGDDGKF